MFRVERAMEDIRRRLSKRPYFNLREAFDFLDRNREGCLRAFDLRDRLAE